MELQAADQEQFNVYNLSVEGVTLGSLYGDFNGDKLDDIAILYIPTQIQDERRFVGVFFQSASAGFSARPNVVAPLPMSASQFQAIDLDSDGKDEFVFLDHLGSQSISWKQTEGFGQPVRIARKETIFRAGNFRGALVDDFAMELNGNSTPELILPTTDGIALFESADKGAFKILNELQMESIGRSSDEVGEMFRRRVHRSYQIEAPEIIAADANADGKVDLYFLWTDRVCVFIQDQSGVFSRTPDVTLRLQDDGLTSELQTLLVDCNADSRPDLVVLRMRGGIAAAECNVDFYLCDASGKLPSAPNRTITLSQARTFLMVSDIDGDKIPELALPAVELGSVATIKMMMQRKGGLDLLIYRLQGGLPPEDASVRHKLNFSLDFSDVAPDREVLLDWSADYNSDGLNDLAYSDGGGNMLIYFGAKGRYLSDDATVEIAAADARALKPVDLNHDGRSDLVVERNNSGKINGVWAFISRK